MSKYYTMSDLTPDLIREYREKNSLSQEEFAKRSGVAPSTISRFESGEGKLSDESAAKILAYLNKVIEDNAASKSTIDDNLVNTVTNQVIERLIEYSETTIKIQMKTFQIPSAALFTKDYTFGEMQEMLTKVEKELVDKVKSTVRDRLERIKCSE